jgi:hypothetical protein
MHIKYVRKLEGTIAWEIKVLFGGRFKMDLSEIGCGWNLSASGQGSTLFNKWQQIS